MDSAEALIGNLFNPQLVSGVAKATSDVKAAIDLNAALWLDLLKMARNVIGMIPIPSLYITFAMAAIDMLIRYLESVVVA